MANGAFDITHWPRLPTSKYLFITEFSSLAFRKCNAAVQKVPPLYRSAKIQIIIDFKSSLIILFLQIIYFTK